MKYILKITAILTLALIYSCSPSEVFKEELYKNVFSIISSDGYNVFAVTHDLRESESIGYVAVSMGGTNATERALEVNLIEDHAPLDAFNKGNYDVEYDRYAQALASKFYDINEYKVKMAAGETLGKMAVRVRPVGLCPDSIYFIPLSVHNFTAYELNPDKANVLYRVLLKNYYTYQTTSSNGLTYNVRGTLDGGNLISTQVLFPLGANSVRVMPANETYSGDTAVINNKSVILEVDASNNVTVKPYKWVSVEMQNSDPDYPNKFSIEYDGFNYFKTFLLHFKYRNNGETNWKEIKEELRLQFNPNDDK
jgi:hypothetical protein